MKQILASYSLRQDRNIPAARLSIALAQRFPLRSQSLRLGRIYQTIYSFIQERWQSSRGKCAIDYFDSLYFYLLEIEREALDQLNFRPHVKIADAHLDRAQRIMDVVKKHEFCCGMGHILARGPNASKSMAA